MTNNLTIGDLNNIAVFVRDLQGATNKTGLGFYERQELWDTESGDIVGYIESIDGEYHYVRQI